MEEEAEKLQQIRSQAEQNLPETVSLKPVIPTFKSAEDQKAADERSVYVGNVRNYFHIFSFFSFKL